MSKSNRTILLVDDDAWFSDSLVTSLNDYLVIKTSDPDQVFDLIERYRPDLILADIMLGARNLFALLHEMQSHLDTRDVPVVILSAIAKRIDPIDAEQLGVRLVLDKAEITPDILADRIASIIAPMPLVGTS